MSDYINSEGSSISRILPTSQNQDSFYTLVVDADNQGFDNVKRYISLDKVDSLSLNSDSDITSYPLLTGDTMSDHKYDHPKTIQLRCEFSLNGRFNNSFVEGSYSSNRLKNIETYFEAVQKYGKTMSLICGLKNGTRFRQRDNLIIQSIQYEYGLNNIKMNLGLKEVYFFESGSDIEVSEYEGDPNLPTLAEFKTLDFSEDIIGQSNTAEMAIRALNDNGLIQKEFAEDIANNNSYWRGVAIIEIGKVAAVLLALAAVMAVKIAAAVAATTGVAATLSATAVSVPVVGAIIVAVAAIAIGVGVMIHNAIERDRKSKLIQEFTYYSNHDQESEEFARFMRYIKTVQDAFDEIASNNDIKCYGFSSNTNKQEMYLSIDDNIYQFDFEQNVNKRWQMRVTKIGNTEEQIDLKGNTAMTGNRDFLSLKFGDALFHTKNYVYVYLINKAYVLEDYDDSQLGEILNNSWKAGNCGFLGYTKEEMDKDKENPPTSDLVAKFRNEGIYKDLTQFELVVTDVDMSKLKENLDKALYNCLLRQNQ